MDTKTQWAIYLSSVVGHCEVGGVSYSLTRLSAFCDSRASALDEISHLEMEINDADGEVWVVNHDEAGNPHGVYPVA